MNLRRTKEILELPEDFYNELNIAKSLLDESKNPFFFFDDDPDGVCAFLQLYKYKKEGDFSIVKSSPRLNKEYAKKVSDENDRVFILDKPLVEDEFFYELRNHNIIWIDHHDVQERKNNTYINPRKYGINIPTSLITYLMVHENMWIAAIGTIGDWFLPPFLNELSERYPDLISKEIKKPQDALFNSGFGKLTKIVSFNLMGKSNQIKKSIKCLIQIKDPYEIINEKSDCGRYLLKRFNEINEEYSFHLNQANSNKDNSKVLIYIYNSKVSFTKDLANELLYLNPDKIIVIGRESNGIIKLSFRSSDIKLTEKLPELFLGLNGGCGGHEHACGGHIKKEEFEELKKRLKEAFY